MPKRAPRNTTKPPAGAAGQANKTVGERLQKFLAAAGLGSRRQCEELILAGRVEVDRTVVDELGARVDSNRQEVRVDGEVIERRRRVYFAVHKPPNVVSTNRDPAGRTRVIDLVPAGEELFTVGRLDKSSEGLILVTNDGELANQLAHPRYGVTKTYEVETAGRLEPETVQSLRQGTRLAEAYVRPTAVRIKRRFKNSTLLEMVLREGRNREIRRLLAANNHKVQRLRRIALGPLRLGDLPAGAYRELSPREIAALRSAAKTSAGDARPKKAVGRKKAPAPKPTGKKSPPKGPGKNTGSKRPTIKKKRPAGKTRQTARPGRKKSSRKGRR
jgi:23S rRNA pseudouridine2605 synthase